MNEYICMAVWFFILAALDLFALGGDDFWAILAISNIYIAASWLYADLK